MICENCNINEANVHFKHTENGSATEMHLCVKCAAEKGIYGGKPKINLSDFFSGLIENSNSYAGTAQVDRAGKPGAEKCEKCGMTFNDFRRTGKAGCSNCYEVFGRRMEPLIKRLHGSTVHKGRIPETLYKELIVSSEINNLKDLLKKAIKEEQYEKAAEIRDQIKKIECAKSKGGEHT